MKTQTQYEPHNADNLQEGWDAVHEYAKDALLAAWDGCHKIYLAMDEAEAEWFRINYAEHIVECDDDIVDTVEGWWDESCSLRFVNAVWRNESDPNAGFVSLISQFADDDDADDDDFDDLWHDDEDEDN
jgi:hypothetical protein